MGNKRSRNISIAIIISDSPVSPKTLTDWYLPTVNIVTVNNTRVVRILVNKKSITNCTSGHWQQSRLRMDPNP